MSASVSPFAYEAGEVVNVPVKKEAGAFDDEGHALFCPAGAKVAREKFAG